MKKHLSILSAAALAFAISAALPVVADTVIVPKGNYSYVYYPNHEIYFRPETKMYFTKRL